MQTEQKPPETPQRQWARPMVAWTALVVVAAIVVVIGFIGSGPEEQVVVETPSTTLPTPAPTTVPAPDVPGAISLAPAYRGTIFGDETCCDAQWLITLNLADGGDEITGDLTHSNPSRVPGVYLPGEARMPLEITRQDDTLTLFWDESVGPATDDTTSQCPYTELSLTLTIEDDGSVLSVVDGHLTGGPLPTEGEAIELCHTGSTGLAGRFMLPR